MKIVNKNRVIVPFREIVNGDIFYTKEFNDYGMRIVAKDTTTWNAIILTSGTAIYIPADLDVEIVEGSFVEE